MQKRIFTSIIKYNRAVFFIPREDVYQEIDIICFLHKDYQTAVREASKAIYRLIKAYGYSRKKGKDSFYRFVAEESVFTAEQVAVLDEIYEFYIVKDHTAKETLSRFEITDRRAVKWLCQAYPKGKGLGGKRKGAGRPRVNNRKKNAH